MRILDAGREPRAVEEALRTRTDGGESMQVREILDVVKRDGDEALTNYTRQFDCRFIDSLGLRVAEREREAAYGRVEKDFLRALRVARGNITAYHKRQRRASWTLRRGGTSMTQRVQPLARVGIYVPGGKAAYPSTVLMNALPARIAGVKEIVMTTPCNADGKIAPEVLVAASECGITEMYRVGGAQAIAALAYGTESIRRVDKITGPGNAYVASAKRQLFGVVGIDSIAGPTELVILADITARADFVAADLIAQAEHDEMASPICITNSAALALAVVEEIERQLALSPRRAVAQQACDGRGAVIVVPSPAEGIAMTNAIAPEHVEIMMRNPARVARLIRNAGAVFVGPWTTEALGDYVLGPNHTLPTSGTARFSSALSVYDFLRFTNIITSTQRGFAALSPHAEVLATAEGLAGHAASLRIRRMPR